MIEANPALHRPSSDVPALDTAQRASLLQRLNVDARRLRQPSLEALTELQWAFLIASPFHNLELLAGNAPRTPKECIDAVLCGRGGTCQVQATAFLALLLSLGYQAHLAAATIREPGDHIVVVVHLAEGSFVCDVGNGHPYRRPFPLRGTMRLEHMGWMFESEGGGDRLTLRRRLDDGRWNTVYTVDPEARCYADFVPKIVAHHEVEGFGPFLNGLRAVRILPDLVVTLRDLMLRRYSLVGLRTRRVPHREAAARVLRRSFGFDDGLVYAALERLQRQKLEVVTETSPRIAVSLATTDRPESFVALLESLADAWRAEGEHNALRVFIVENSRCRDTRKRNAEFVSRICDIGELDVLLMDDGDYGRSIAASRRAQVAHMARRYAAGEHLDVVWMVDDDVLFEQLVYGDDRLLTQHAISYFRRIRELYNEHPEASVLIGRVCGDPPIRPEAVLCTQLFDLVANVERFIKIAPDAPYNTPDQRCSFALPDYYYDHSTAGIEHLATPFYWIPRGTSCTVRRAAWEFLCAMKEAFYGRTVTRPLLHVASTGPQGELYETVLRGGNAVFLDLDAVFRHPYPSFKAEGVASRRSDMVGSAILCKEGASWTGNFPCPITHRRRAAEMYPRVEQTEERAILRSFIGEFAGVLLARWALSPKELDLGVVAKARVERILACLQEAARLSDRAMMLLERAAQSWMGAEPEIARALAELRRTLDWAQQVYFGGQEPSARAGWFAKVERALSSPEMVASATRYANDELKGDAREQRAAIARLIQGRRDA